MTFTAAVVPAACVMTGGSKRTKALPLAAGAEGEGEEGGAPACPDCPPCGNCNPATGFVTGVEATGGGCTPSVPVGAGLAVFIAVAPCGGLAFSGTACGGGAKFFGGVFCRGREKCLRGCWS